MRHKDGRSARKQHDYRGWLCRKTASRMLLSMAHTHTHIWSFSRLKIERDSQNILRDCSRNFGPTALSRKRSLAKLRDFFGINTAWNGCLWTRWNSRHPIIREIIGKSEDRSMPAYRDHVDAGFHRCLLHFGKEEMHMARSCVGPALQAESALEITSKYLAPLERFGSIIDRRVKALFQLKASKEIMASRYPRQIDG